MSHKKLSYHNAVRAFQRILELPKDTRDDILQAFDGALDELRDSDLFGTEGQLDPRGDPRR
jgi:hypothetical protein